MASLLHRRSDAGHSHPDNLESSVGSSDHKLRSPPPISAKAAPDSHVSQSGSHQTRAAGHRLFSTARVSLQLKCLIALGTLCMVAFMFRQKPTGVENGDGHDARRQTIVFPVYSRYPYSLEAALNIAMQKQPLNGTIAMDPQESESSNAAARKLKAESADWIIYGRAGSFYIKLIVGGNPYYLIIDSGSWMTWVLCKCALSKCSMAPDISLGDFYELDHSYVVTQGAAICTSFQSRGEVPGDPESVENHQSSDVDGKEPCYIKIQYGLDRVEAETNLLLVLDWLTIPFTNDTTCKVLGMFGCAYRILKDDHDILFDSNGILGLDRSNTTLPAQLEKKDVINNVVGHCISAMTCHYDPDNLRERVKHGECQTGYLFMGDNSYTSEGTSMTWADLVDTQGLNFYLVKARDFRYGTSPVSYAITKDSPVFISFDSGSATSHISSKIFPHLLRVIDTDAVEMGYTRLVPTTSFGESKLPLSTITKILNTFKYCWIIPTRQRNVKKHPYKLDFKDLQLQFGDSIFKIPPLGYMLQMKPQVLCFAIYETQSEMNLIGALALRGYMFVYDNVRERVGWRTQRACNIEEFKKSLKTRKRPYIDI